MIGKITKGTSFGGCVRYVLREEKSQLLEAVDVNGVPEQMAEQFELQTLLNDKVKNTVGHISLNISSEDGEQMRTDDALMLKIAHDYMEKMNIKNTQFIIARHTDREHPHCHIVFNRVDNDGKTISDKNDRYHNEKVCKMMTAKYRLHFANGKDHIKEERLRPYDKAKYTIYKALKEELPKAQSWNELKEALSERNIDMKFKASRTTRELQGVKFEYGGLSFSGSKVDREFSYLNINRQFEQSAIVQSYNEIRHTHQIPAIPKEQPQKQNNTESNFSFGLLSGCPILDTPTAEEQDMNELLRRKKKKAKRKRGFRL